MPQSMYRPMSTSIHYEPYVYRAYVVRVYDGDTFWAIVDLGFGIELKGVNPEGHEHKGVSFRLHRINTPEVRGDERPDGIKARDYVREQILNQEVLVETVKDEKGKFGRWLSEVWVERGDGFINLNDHLVERGLAEYVDY